MQPAWQSRLEISVDFVVSLVINLGTQYLYYGVLATASRSLLFAGLLLGLAVPRRYAIRRLFTTLVAPGSPQSRWASWCEVSVDTILALFCAIVLQRLLYGAAATWAVAGGLTGALYLLTMGRRYALRRGFEAWQTRQDQTSQTVATVP